MNLTIYFGGAGGAIALLIATLTAPVALADIKVGVTLPLTGGLASFGDGADHAIAAWPKIIDGEAVVVKLTDDGGDPGRAADNARYLLTVEKVDLLVSSPAESLVVAAVARENDVAYLTVRPAPTPTERDNPLPPRVPHERASLPSVVFEHMKANRVATVGFIGFSDSWGDLWLKELQEHGARLGLALVAEERYGRADSSVDAQVAKLVAAKPDAILVAASGAAAMLPQLALRGIGYAGLIYHTHDSATNNFIRIAGSGAAGTILPATPSIVAEIGAKQELNVQPGGAALDAGEMLVRLIPAAIEVARPGSKEFRVALRKAAQDAMGATDPDADNHDNRVWVLVTVKDDAWSLAR
jgi:branched-chain amino acid transport system substrate-binding protein